VGHLLANAFTQILTDVAGYYVISERRILALTETRGLRPDEAATDPGFGAALAGELGAGALLSGRLSRLGETFVLSASLLELPSDVVLKSFQAQSETVEGLLEDLPELVTARILGPGTHLPEGTPPETVPTRSIDAYSHYLRGEDLLIEGIWEDAVEELNLAVEEDPEMGLAWSALSCAYSFSGDDVRARAAHQKASEFLHSLNEKERRWVELDGIWVTTGNGDQYLQKMQQYINDYPDDPRNFLYAGMGLEWLQNRPEDAIEWYETARELMPLNFPVVKTTADCYLKLGRRADAVRVLEEYAHHPFLGDDNRGRASEALDLIRNP
jgi:tetratricopeptide (TPR) repeat protein